MQGKKYKFRRRIFQSHH